MTTGAAHACAFAPGGHQVWCWGNDEYGQLGDGNGFSISTVPVAVQGLVSSVVAVSAGGEHTCAVTSAGGVQCWGYNGSGQLGDNSPFSSNFPVNVQGLTGVVGVYAGMTHTCALTSAGAVQCWGGNAFGQLGNDSTTNSPVPVGVQGLTAGVVALSVGDYYACAITSSHALVCWGGNGHGELGNNTTTDSGIPVSVVGLAAGVSAVSAGSGHTCAITSTGAGMCWGYNGHGELGNNSTTNSTVPVEVTGL
jgi:alpha-tubulin suppressor-like RCC1 family protein